MINPSSSSPQPSSPSPRPAKRKSRRGLAVFSLVLLGVVSASVGALLRSPIWQKYGFATASNFFHPKTPADVFPENPHAMNLMIVGQDYDYTDQDQIIKNHHGRSDMLMVARIDFDNKDIHFLSIPRDTRADVPGFGVGKVNGANAHGGPQLAAQTVQANFGIPSDKYVELDFKGFEQAIDKLGGVDLTVDRQMDYDDNWGHLHIHLKPGYQHLNGQQAMGFVRFRHADSDFYRIKRQQALLAALKAKLHQPQTLAKLPAILEILDNHLESDLTTDQKLVLASFLQQVPHDKIAMATLPSRDSRSTLIPTDWEKARPLIQTIFGVAPPEQVAEETPRHHRRHRRHRAYRVADAQ